MKVDITIAGLCASLLLVEPVRGEDRFELGFRGAATAPASGGQYLCTLSHSGDGPGAQGWSIGVAAENAMIADVETSGTAGDLAPVGFRSEVAFESTSLVENEEGELEGAVSAVVLSLLGTVSLPPNTTQVVARVTVLPPTPENPTTATLRYLDGLEPPNSPPWSNSVTQSGTPLVPALTSQEIRFAPCDASSRLDVGFSRERISSPEPFSGILGAGPNSTSGGELSSETGAVEVFVNLVSRLSAEGAQAWTLSVALEGEAELIAATTRSTAGAVSPVGLRLGDGFERTELVTSLGDEILQGAVSAVVLSLRDAVTLAPRGTESVLNLELASSNPFNEEERTAVLSLRNGLRGTGQPVENLVTVRGRDEVPCNLNETDLEVKFLFATEPLFDRGDANADGRMTISDAVFTAAYLFLGSGDNPPCLKAADTNDDGNVDLSDAIFTLGFLFGSGQSPPAPQFCDVDPTEDSLSCEEYSSC